MDVQTTVDLPAVPMPRPYGAAPSPEFLALHEHPVVRVRKRAGHPMWLVTRIEDAKRLLTDPSVVVTPPGGARQSRYGLSPLVTQSLFALDGPGHAKLRRLVTPAFSVRRLARLRPRIERMVDDLIDRMLAEGPPADLRASLSSVLPVWVICDLLGVPRADGPQLSRWTDSALMSSDEGDGDRAWRDWRALSDHLGVLLAAKRAEPGEDLLSDLVAALDADPELTEQQVIALAATMMVAGHETTAVVIEYATVGLLHHPGEFARLAADPALVPAAVEEILRLYPPTAGDVGTVRFTTADLEVAGVLIPAGSTLMFSFRALSYANEGDQDLGRLDIRRTDTPHLVFSHGPHHCVGAALARLELTAVFERVPARLPGLRLAVPAGHLRPRLHVVSGGLEEVPLTWDTTA
ncbi:cytochrome P450 [Kibdelosporangium banguiense]|uniref:Cytochrome P450 n=1 Tax=Kibdelosporangium banguiense TaxID=1365924 RepID=A0ABS4TPW6_9PSEU|nr:cytochrome P450 [Kibdelosporangium banguiense]MBP2326445.1 cytochrome P450 [Kibdelosporangium banguiense]